jgi:hypothetical protein
MSSAHNWRILGPDVRLKRLAEAQGLLRVLTEARSMKQDKVASRLGMSIGVERRHGTRALRRARLLKLRRRLAWAAAAP